MDPPFAVRIVTADFYMAKPVSGFDVGYSDFRCSPVRHVPVIRIYGATPAGQRTCLHIHGVFPYVYVSCEDVWQTSSEFMHHLSSSVDRALHLCLDRGTRTPEHAVYKIVPVSGIPFYGYHEEEKLFLKIYLYNPFMTTRVVKLLQSGAVMNRPFQPHEAHIPYLLQFFIDYNLYGMSFIELAIVKFRLPLTPGSDQFCSASLFSSDDKSSELDSQRRQVWREANVSKEIILPANVSRQSVCELEVDAVAADILNRRKIGRGTLANPGLAAVWEDERQRRKQKGESSQISHPLSLERKLIEDFEIESNWKKKLHQIIERHMEQIVNDPCRKTETADAVRNEDSFSLSCASQVENHLSQINQELMGSDSVMYEEEGIVDEEVIQQVLEISQSQPAYSQRVDSETVRLLANLDQLQQVSQSGSQSPANESDIIDGSFPIDQSWESSLNFSQMQHNLSQMVKNSARVLSQTTSESGLASVNRTIESHCIEELLGCGAHIDDEQELSDLVNAVVEEEAESLAMSQCGTWIDKIEENKTCSLQF
ncbi:DNA polymerase zeta catalytic subunit-like [Corticium candelabrum]|uniref:DNA polymerase zeta catalytic subunit-like n=1 Tax=Corticium candelabrum TaxID=121492 RepID=UPI002E273CF2|nr:DNA polymerase zeta catalytic subunit-like [Corticium candelabrum]